MKKYYGSDTKDTYIKQMEAGGKSMPEAEKDLEITENTFFNWKRKLRDDPKRGLLGSRRQKPDVGHPRNTVNENVRPKRYSEKGHSIDRRRQD